MSELLVFCCDLEPTQKLTWHLRTCIPPVEGERVLLRSTCGAESEMYELNMFGIHRKRKMDLPPGAWRSGRWWWQNLGQSQRQQRGPGGHKRHLLVILFPVFAVLLCRNDSVFIRKNEIGMKCWVIQVMFIHYKSSQSSILSFIDCVSTYDLCFCLF